MTSGLTPQLLVLNTFSVTTLECDTATWHPILSHDTYSEAGLLFCFPLLMLNAKLYTTTPCSDTSVYDGKHVHTRFT